MNYVMKQARASYLKSAYILLYSFQYIHVYTSFRSISTALTLITNSSPCLSNFAIYGEDKT
jgi:hypothetical protein